MSRVVYLIFHVTLGKSLIFLSYPMLCLHRVVRPPFGIMLWQRRAVSPISSLQGLEKPNISKV